jgi:HlyD family type I secretion membrane fusion protein
MKVIDTTWRRLPPARTETIPSRPERLGGTILAGYAVIAALILGFALWSWLAPLGSAVDANGRVVVEGDHKAVQHLEDGIIRDILVHNGDQVTAGQILVRLDDTQAKATLKRAIDNYHAAEAQVALLTAEQTQAAALAFPPDLVAAAQTDPAAAKMIAEQSDTFQARHKELASQADILDQQSAQAEAEIGGLHAQIAAQDQQITLLSDEIKDLDYLLARELVAKPQVLEKRRMRADISGQRAENVASIARAEQTIGENRLKIADLRTALINEAAGKLGDAQKDMFDAEQRARAAQDVMDRTIIRAPEAGIVVEQKVHTPGGVIHAGEDLMDIVPVSDRAVVEVKVDVNDVTKVHDGLAAQLRLIGYEQRTTPTVPGKVIWVSADRIDDDKQHSSYYLARIVADPAALEALPGVSLHVGMPVDASIATGERTLLQYVFAPLSRVLSHGMRER